MGIMHACNIKYTIAVTYHTESRTNPCCAVMTLALPLEEGTSHVSRALTRGNVSLMGHYLGPAWGEQGTRSQTMSAATWAALEQQIETQVEDWHRVLTYAAEKSVELARTQPLAIVHTYTISV